MSCIFGILLIGLTILTVSSSGVEKVHIDRRIFQKTMNPKGESAFQTIQASLKG